MAKDSPTLMDNTDEWCLSCSDDEVSPPSASELDALFCEIDKHGILELEWKNPGRRLPSPMLRDELLPDHSDNGSTMEEKGSNFDFMDEVSSPQMRVRAGECELKGSAKKKTSSFNGILNNIRRHQILSRIEKGSHNQSPGQQCSSTEGERPPPPVGDAN